MESNIDNKIYEDTENPAKSYEIIEDPEKLGVVKNLWTKTFGKEASKENFAESAKALANALGLKSWTVGTLFAAGEWVIKASDRASLIKTKNLGVNQKVQSEGLVGIIEKITKSQKIVIHLDRPFRMEETIEVNPEFVEIIDNG